MLEGIRALGEAALEQAPLIEALVDLRPLERLREGEKGYLVVLDVCPNERRLRVDLQQLDKETLVDAFWVGNAAGSNSPQDRLTTDHPEYLASQTVPNLLKTLPKDGSLVVKLRTLREAAYIDLGEKGELFPNGGGDGQYERYRQVWDLRKLGLNSVPDLLSGRRDREEVERICTQEGVEFLSERFLQGPMPAQRGGRRRSSSSSVKFYKAG
ncbi:MAG: hypothetical protein KatS3mg131_1989 [Candidatus Tectimicrobiota bacterium]|nr:MAG: hypothetical protein KatS3mg131_1989 [Candidatus Tectomicrobia bacterium]